MITKYKGIYINLKAYKQFWVDNMWQYGTIVGFILMADGDRIEDKIYKSKKTAEKSLKIIMGII